MPAVVDVMVFAEADHRRAPQLGRLARDLLHDLQQLEGVGAPLRIGDSVKERIDTGFGHFCFRLCHDAIPPPRETPHSFPRTIDCAAERSSSAAGPAEFTLSWENQNAGPVCLY